MTNEELLELPCDVLAPCALEFVLTEANAGRVQARIVLEGANGPTTPDADAILEDAGVLVVPDVLANAGGVVVSYFEWVQGLQELFWTEGEVNERLRAIVSNAYARRGTCTSRAESPCGSPPTVSRFSGSPRRARSVASIPETVTLVVARDCHLCERAREELHALRAVLGFTVEEVDITGVPELERRYREWIPVIEVKGERVSVFRVEAPALRHKLGL